ncbi:squalene/phytoene synthase family protein [Sphingomonas sp.]|uniref:squalene/phytoene synthase family protein n=1 Tax=Sphingomonas sp. TaxID=28214 RepID=UPI002D7F612D|nr:squalene/phytoene synthase family protein [Sphingomonas sp.]HEU0044977.1 squalene/phytoene synthase family protein [Sphingomonas sp.]
MVNAAERPERALALTYAPPDRREGLAALFALDDRLRGIVRAARDPTIGLMRLTWWGDALVRLDSAPPPPEPVLAAVARDVLPHGVTGTQLERIADGWARLLEPDAIDLGLFAAEVGETVFIAAATVLGAADERIVEVGRAWSLAELARERPGVLESIRAQADRVLAGAFGRPWRPAARPLGALGLSARFDLEGKSAPGSPRRVARLMLHRLTGR